MKFEEIITVSGKPGLFKILKASKTSYIVEELNEKPKRLVLGNQHRISFLKEISLYTNTADGSVPIQELYEKMKADNTLVPDPKSSSEEELFGFLERLLPEFDAERIYHSDLKKFYSWFKKLSTFAPDMDYKAEPEEDSSDEQEKEESS